MNMKQIFRPYCIFAMIGFSEMKVNSFLRTAKGRGTMRSMKMLISATRSMKTCKTKALADIVHQVSPRHPLFLSRRRTQ